MQPTPSPMFSLLPVLFVFAIFYFMLLRPQQKKQKEHQAMIGDLKKNDEVVTSGGIHGTIVNIKEATFVLRIDENVKMEIDKNSVSYVKKTRE
jgi:preprotein translocase subunit YajC